MDLRAMMRGLTQAAQRAARVPARELVMTLYAGFVILVVELLIRWLPLPRLSRMLRVTLDLSPVPEPYVTLPPRELPEESQLRLRSTNRVLRRWPFCKGPCLRRSLVVAHLLRELHPSIRLGTAGAGDTLRAHAWVEIEHRPLEDVGDYTVLHRPDASN